jgi:hypothetical protein
MKEGKENTSVHHVVKEEKIEVLAPLLAALLHHTVVSVSERGGKREGGERKVERGRSKEGRG